LEGHFKMEETAQGQFEVLLIAVIAVVLATGAALYVKSTANAATTAIQDTADTNTNN
jgi:hypothetical protein